MMIILNTPKTKFYERRPCEKSYFQNLLILKIIQKSIHHFILSKKKKSKIVIVTNEILSYIVIHKQCVEKICSKADVFRSHTSSVVVYSTTIIIVQARKHNP